MPYKPRSPLHPQLEEPTVIVKMGNQTPHPTIVDHDQPCVYTWTDYGSGLTHVAEGRPDGKEALLHVLTNNVPHMPDHEAFVSVVTDWPNHSPKSPAWVDSDDADLAQMLSEAYGCPVGVPEDVEQTHHTDAGPPGVGPVEG